MTTGLAAILRRATTLLTIVLSLSALTGIGQAACLPQPTGLVSWWRAEGGAIDQMNNNFGGVTSYVGYDNGKVGSAFSFSNTSTSDYLQTSSNGMPTGNSPRTLAMWVNIYWHQTTGDSYFAGYGSYGQGKEGQWYALGAHGDAAGPDAGKLFFSSYGVELAGPVISTQEWHHIAVTNTGNSVTLYFDGVPTGPATLGLSTSAISQFFAGYADSSRKMMGKLDEIQLFDRALTAKEISDIYASGTSGLCYSLDLSPSLPDGLKGVYYYNSISVSNAVIPYNVTLDSGSLPQGLILAPDGTVSGIPLAAGTYTFTLSVTDSVSGIGSHAYTITITAPIIGDSTLAAVTWQSIGPYSSRVRSLVIDPSDSQTIYTGTRDGLFKTTNGGASWKMITEGMTNQYIRAIAVSPSDSATLYAGTDGGLFKSVDGGAFWEPSGAGLPDFSAVYALAIDHTNPLVIYAGTSNDGMFRSTNGGASWTAINTGITDFNNIKTIVIDPANSQKITIGTYSGGAYVSTDGGAGWAPSTLTAGALRHITYAPGSSQLMFAASADTGVMISTDAGATWGPTATSLVDQLIYYVAVHPADSQILFAGSGIGPLYRSTDRGQTWSLIFTGKTAINRIAFDPANLQVIYLGLDNNGMFKSINSGTTWTPVSYGMTNTAVQSMAIDHSNSQTVYAATWTSVSKSVDGGANWSVSYDGSSNNIGHIAIDPVDSRTLYVSRSDDVIIKTTDGGAAWSPLPASPVNAFPLVVAPNNSQTLYTAAYPQLLRSSNGGAFWTEIRNASTYVFSIAVDPLNSQIVYVGSQGEIWKSSTGGSNWSVTSGLADNVLSLVIDPANSQTVYAAAYNRLLRSLDGGGSWNTVSTLPIIMEITKLALDPADSRIIYAGTNGNGVFVSTNSGETWNVFNNGLPTNSDIWYLGFDPANSKTLYAGTESSSAYKTVVSTTPTLSAPTVVYLNENASGSFKVLSSGWPNPDVSVSGSMPDGLTFAPLTGTVSGTPGFGSASALPYTLIFTADNGHPPAASRAVSVYILDPSSLTITVSTPANGAQVTSPPTSIKGSRSNSATITVQITDGSTYLQPDGNFTTSPVWLSATANSTSWMLDISQNAAWVEGITYTIIARAQTTSTKTVTSSFRIIPAANKSVTVLTASFTPEAIKVGDTASIGGALTKADGSPLPAKTIKVIVTPPATQAVPVPDLAIYNYTTDSSGLFSSPDLPTFTVPGIYTVQARFEGDVENQAATLPLSLPVIAQSGYAIIVVGKANDNSLLDLHKATAAAIKGILINKRGFLTSNIISITSNDSTTKSKISAALATIKPAYQSAPAPVYLVMIDHGSPDPGGGFILGSQTLLPSELDAMLNTFESYIDPKVLATNKRFVIMGTCYSGLFQSVSKPGRVVITSAAATEQSLAGSVSYSGNTPALSGGDYFMDTLFSFLGRGDSFKNAFNQARNAVALRDPRKVPLGLHSGEVDALAQHPLLNDDGNASGSYRLEGSSDGVASASLYLGEGVRVPAEGNPTDITAVLPTTILGTSTSGQTLWMQVRDSSRVDRAWVEIRTPATTASNGGTGQVIPGGLDSMPLIYDGQKWVGDYSLFIDPGRYDVYYYARDIQTGDTSPMAHTVIYKKKSSNTAPSDFALSAPANASQMKLPFPLAWHESSDSDGKTYSLIVATDQNFSTIIYREDDIPVGATILPESALRDPANPGFYYCQNNNAPCWWKVRAIDAFGEETWSNSRNFNVLMSNALFVMIKAYVTSGGLPVSDASCSVSSGDSVVSLPTGLCLMTTSSLPVTASFSAAGYTAQSSVAVPEPIDNVSLLSVSLSPAATTHTLNLTTAGNGSGLVNCSKGLETVECNGTFNAADTISLLATNDWKTLPVSWGGDCSGTVTSVCNLLMSSDRNAVATFDPNYQARIVSPPYSSGSLQSALNSAGNGATVEAMDYDFLEPILFDRSGFEVTIDGGRGYPGYTLPATGYSTVQESFRIKQGTIKVKGPMAVR